MTDPIVWTVRCFDCLRYSVTVTYEAGLDDDGNRVDRELSPREVLDRRLRSAGSEVMLEELLIARPEWHRDALCREHPEIDWFPEVGEDRRPAKAICARCPVREQCLAAGIDNPDGIWGGLGWRERRRLRRTR